MSPRFQENAGDLKDASEADRPKFAIGQRLRYLGPSDDIPPRFAPGDLLMVADRNGCGMGIDAHRISDGVTDMVWPWETVLDG